MTGSPEYDYKWRGKQRKKHLALVIDAVAKGAHPPEVNPNPLFEWLRGEVAAKGGAVAWATKQGTKKGRTPFMIAVHRKRKKLKLPPLGEVSDAVRELYNPAEATEEVVTQEALTKDDILKKAEAASNEAWDYKKVDWSST
ncbi:MULTISPECIES: hypothetical protein [unclassified Roseobacter]|uniref:hypothetical protein n=1 Tax=unclassified Roseobacter TaxID=196798 RepID=UPI0030EF7D6D